MEDDEGGMGSGYLGNWVEDDWSFLFFSAPCPKAIQQLLNKNRALVLLEDYHFTYEEWQGGGLVPIRIAPLVIVPPWDASFDVAGGESKIFLDPGVVFGTGLHPTTRDCLRALVDLRKRERFHYVVDLGTGTGILSLAAAKLGAKQVAAVDLNPLCVRTTRKNIESNCLEDVVRVEKSDARRFAAEGIDLLLANIHYEAMLEIVEKTCSGQIRWFILSGLMRSQFRRVKDHVREKGLTLIREWDHEMTWYTMLLRG